jgi:hypothetical protein
VTHGYSIELSLADAHGNSVSGIYGPDGKQPAEPTVQIFHQGGKLLKTAKFTYG